MPISGPDVLLKERRGQVFILTMNRPERMNSLGGGLPDRLAEAWEEFAYDDNLRVAILTGAGDRAFSAGADLKETADTVSATGALARARPRPTLGAGLEVWKPIIAAINGYAIAGGWNLAQQCDIRIAAEEAELGIAEARWNMPAGWICTLPRIIGLGNALEMALWANRRISAQRAYEMGFVNKVVPRARLMDEAMEWAEQMVELAPMAVSFFKEILYRSTHLSHDEARALAAHIEKPLATSEDIKEGPRAFVEKRRPQWKGR